MANKPEKRNYKDKMFLHLFGECKNAKENFLSLYNAINYTDLKINEVHIEPNQLVNIAHDGLYNDISMIIDNKLIILVEHQSSVNINMPLRCLEYITELYSRFVDSEKKYNSKLLKLPTPEFYVMYNGKSNYPEESSLKLSDAFEKSNYSKSLRLDLETKVYNIRKELNPKILNRCEVLNGYSTFVMLAEQAKSKGEKQPLKYATEKCIQQGILTDYFKQLSKEEREMIFTNDYDYDTDIRVKTKEAFEDGAAQKALEDAVIVVRDFNIPIETAAEKFKVDLEELKLKLSKQ